VRDALAAGVKESGTTIHWLDAGIDTGQIIAQESVAIIAGDTE
jgi:phosphoribosylglycinamide formyltransferase-1